MSSPTPFRVPEIPSHRLTARARLGRYLRQAYSARHSILQFNRTSDSLSNWPWYYFLAAWWTDSRIDSLTYRPTNSESGDRVTPAELLGHCRMENTPRPCCLCPLTDPTKPALVEAHFLLADEGAHAGEYVAKCTEDLCGYFGTSRNPSIGIEYQIKPIRHTSVPIQRIYGNGHLNYFLGSHKPGGK